jgi:type I restriction enzyme S subunit
MNAELLLEHFHRLGDAPDAVPRLRRFILDLAVRGKLVEQSAKDEPARELLKRIEKEQAAQPSTRKKEFVAPPIDPDDVRFGLPANWTWARTQQVTIYVQRGKSPKYSLEKKIPVIAQKCVQWSGFQLEKAQFIEPKSIESYGEERFVLDGDLLWNSTGHGSLGRLIVFKERFKGTYPRIVADSHVTVIRPSKLVNPDYLFCWFAGPQVQDEINDKSTGTTNQTELPVGTVLSYDVPLPPLAEQHRIVAKVNELMALCDTLEAVQQEREQQRTRLTAASWQAVVGAGSTDAARFALEHLTALTTRPEQVKALRQTILDLAVRGKLVEQDAKDKFPIDQVISSRDKAMRDLNLKRHPIYKLPDGDVLPFELAQGWSALHLSDLMYSCATGYGNDPGPGLETVNVVKVGNVANDGHFKGEFGRRGFTPKEVKKLVVAKNDIIVVKSSGSAENVHSGKAALCGPEHSNKLIATNFTLRLRVFSDAVAPDYLIRLLNSPYCRDWVAETVQTLTYPNLSWSDYSRMPVAIPPLAEQGRIVAKVDELMALCDALEAALRSGEELKGRLLEAVLASGSDDQPIRRSENLASPKASRRRSGMRAGLVAQQEPAGLAQPKVAAAPMAVYAEVEDELNLAAEPAGSFAPKRGRGRPRKDAPYTATAETSIAAYLKEHPGWHAKSAVLAATGVDAAAWNAVIKALLNAGSVERQGEKKGARYRGKPA